MSTPDITSRAGIADPSRMGLMAQVSGALFLIGSLLVAVSLVFPSDTDPHNLVIAVSLAFPLCLGAGLLLAGRRLPPAAFHALPVLATAILTTYVYLSGDPASPFALLFVWVVGWVAAFFTPRAVVFHTILVGVAYAGVLLAQAGAAEVAARWLLTMGTLAFAAALIALLTQTVRTQTTRLQEAARTDVLTGLPNRRAWEEMLPGELNRAIREGGSLSVAILDLDCFKDFNDRLGHQAGDRLLRSTGAAWRGRVRSTDMLARYGGDEFALILPGCALPEARELVEELRGMVPGPKSCSAGVAEWDGSENAERFLARADDALYAAKRTGRDQLIPALVA